MTEQSATETKTFPGDSPWFVNLNPDGSIRLTLRSPEGDEMSQVIPNADVIHLTRLLSTWRYVAPYLNTTGSAQRVPPSGPDTTGGSGR